MCRRGFMRLRSTAKWHGRGERPPLSCPGTLWLSSTGIRKAFLRNGHRRRWLEDEAEGLGAPMQVVDDPRTITDLVGGRARVAAVRDRFFEADANGGRYDPASLRTLTNLKGKCNRWWLSQIQCSCLSPNLSPADLTSAKKNSLSRYTSRSGHPARRPQ